MLQNEDPLTVATSATTTSPSGSVTLVGFAGYGGGVPLAEMAERKVTRAATIVRAILGHILLVELGA